MSIVRVENVYTAELELPPHNVLSEDQKRVVKAYPARRLQRGVCSLPGDYWGHIKDHSTVQSWLDNDMIRVEEGAAPAAEETQPAVKPETKRKPIAAVKKSTDIVNMSPAAAAQAVAAESNVDTLLEWGSRETRHEVLTALEARVAIIEREQGKKV